MDYDVKAYGAVGDGVTDDSRAIPAALAAAAASSQAHVVIPPGTYLIKETLRG